MKMRKSSLVKILFFLVLVSNAYADSAQKESAYQRANKAVIGALDAADNAKGGQQSIDTQAIKDKVAEWMSSGAYSEQEAKAQAVYDRTMEARQESVLFGDQQQAIERIKKTGKVYVFISSSIPDGVLRSLFLSLNDQDFDFEVEIAFRGMFEGDKTFIDFSRSAGQLVSRLGLRDTKAVVGMNPTAYREFSVSDVPQLVYVHEDGSITRRKGSINVRGFYESLTSTGVEQQRLGEIYKIAERDFFEEIEERLAKIDFDKRIEAAKDNYWNKVVGDFKNLPQSSEHEVRDVDMTVTVSKDIIANDGYRDHVIAREGERFNPLDQPMMASFNRNMIIFDPNSNAQLEWAKKAVEKALAANEMPVVLLAKFIIDDREKSLSLIEKQLSSVVYLADKKILERFNVKAVPVLIKKSPVHGSMRVTQYACEYDRCGAGNE